VKEAYAEEIRYTTTANLNMRTGVGTHNRILLTIPKGRQITYVASKNGWYQVRYGGRDGYVSSAYVKKTVAASSSPVSSTPISGAGQVKTTGALNFRTGPDKTYARVGTMPKNTTVSYSEIKNGWYLITYNGKTGYASGRYLTVLSQNAAVPSTPNPATPMEPE
jgi:D-alanyl-D-alanine carboxypeptidase